MTDNGIKTTHVGSLPRPEPLRELLADSPSVSDDELDTAISEAVRTVVRRQAEVGIDIGNDGEQSRLAYSVDVTNRLSGFGDDFVDRALPSDLEDFPEFADRLFGDIETIGGPIATGPIEYTGEAQLREHLTRFSDAVDAERVTFDDRFYTAPSPGAVLRFTDSTYHDSKEDYLFDLAEALATEYELIADAGLTLQIDAPELLAGFTITYKESTVAEFRDHVRTYVDAINRALADVPGENVRLHACWGNYPGPHHRDVSLSDVIDGIYAADVTGLIVEGANPRHQHEYKTFSEHPLPSEWTLVPGVIDVKTNVIEHPEVVADRLERFATAVGDPSRIIAGADCGFETVLGANFVDPAIAWKKLEALAEGAELATTRLS